MFLLFGILQFHVGVRITPIAQAEQGCLASFAVRPDSRDFMARKKRKVRKAGPPELSPKLVEQRLLATSFPRLQMVLILSLAALGA